MALGAAGAIYFWQVNCIGRQFHYLMIVSKWKFNCWNMFQLLTLEGTQPIGERHSLFFFKFSTDTAAETLKAWFAIQLVFGKMTTDKLKNSIFNRRRTTINLPCLLKATVSFTALIVCNILSFSSLVWLLLWSGCSCVSGVATFIHLFVGRSRDGHWYSSNVFWTSL